jgi:hypothetical protein
MLHSFIKACLSIKLLYQRLTLVIYCPIILSFTSIVSVEGKVLTIVFAGIETDEFLLCFTTAYCTVDVDYYDVALVAVLMIAIWDKFDSDLLRNETFEL